MTGIPDQDGNIVGFYEGRILLPGEYNKKVHTGKVLCSNEASLFHYGREDSSYYRHGAGMTVKKCNCLTKKDTEKKLGKSIQRFKSENKAVDAITVAKIGERVRKDEQKKKLITDDDLLRWICKNLNECGDITTADAAFIMYRRGMIEYWEMLFYTIAEVSIKVILSMCLKLLPSSSTCTVC